MPRTPKHSTPAELAELASMARNRAPGLSDVTLRVQTDLLITGGRPQTDMARAYEALLTALLPRIEPRTVDIVLGKLVKWPHLTDGLSALIRQHRPELLLVETPHMDRTETRTAPTQAPEAQEQGQVHETPLPPVAAPSRRLAPAPAASDPQAGDLQQLVAQARGDKALARLLVSQTDLPALALAPLFAQADIPAKARILAAIQRHLDIAPVAAPPRATTPEIAQAIALMCTQPGAAAAMMADILDGGETLAKALSNDEDRTLTTLATMALGFEPEETIRLLLVTGDAVARSTGRIAALADLARNVSPACALRLVAAMSGVAIAKPIGANGREHVPQAAPSGTPVRPGQAATVKPARKTEWTVHLTKPSRPAG